MNQQNKQKVMLKLKWDKQLKKYLYMPYILINVTQFKFLTLLIGLSTLIKKPSFH